MSSSLQSVRDFCGPVSCPSENMDFGAIALAVSSASSHKWEAYRRRRFCRFSRRERRTYLDPYLRSEQRRKSAKSPSALRVGLKRVRLRCCSFVTYRSGYAPHSRLAAKPYEANGVPPAYETMH